MFSATKEVQTEVSGVPVIISSFSWNCTITVGRGPKYTNATPCLAGPWWLHLLGFIFSFPEPGQVQDFCLFPSEAARESKLQPYFRAPPLGPPLSLTELRTRHPSFIPSESGFNKPLRELDTYPLLLGVHGIFLPEFILGNKESFSDL